MFVLSQKRLWLRLNQWSPTFLAPGSSFVEDNFSTGGGGGGREDRRWTSGENGSETPLSHPLVTSSCAAQFLTGHGWHLSAARGVGDP